ALHEMQLDGVADGDEWVKPDVRAPLGAHGDQAAHALARDERGQLIRCRPIKRVVDHGRKNPSTARSNSAGFSMFTICPEPSITTSFAPGMRAYNNPQIS